jgi:RNA polymerase sigma factor FliA
MTLQCQPVESEQLRSQRERDKIVLEHLHLVRSVATGVHVSLPVHVDLDDLIQIGILGLLDAATKYDRDKNVSFPSYAKHRIKGAILDGLRQQDWASRDLRTKQRRIAKATSRLTAQLGRAPGESEIAEDLDIEVGTLRKTQLSLQNVSLISMTPASDDNEDRAGRLAGQEDQRPDRISAQSERRAALSQAIDTLPVRYRKIVLMYYVKDMSLKSIGAEIGVNESRISQIHSAALKKMQVALRAQGIQSAVSI